MAEFPVQDTALNRAMALPPSKLTDDDIAAIVAVLRTSRERFVEAKREAKAAGKNVKPPPVEINLDILGLGKGKLI